MWQRTNLRGGEISNVSYGRHLNMYSDRCDLLDFKSLNVTFRHCMCTVTSDAKQHHGSWIQKSYNLANNSSQAYNLYKNWEWQRTNLRGGEHQSFYSCTESLIESIIHDGIIDLIVLHGHHITDITQIWCVFLLDTSRRNVLDSFNTAPVHTYIHDYAITLL